MNDAWVNRLFWGAMANKPHRGEGDGTGVRLGQPQEAYVAFAFAAADLLMEADHSGRIIFAIGASMSLVGRPARLLATMTLPDLIRPDDASRAVNALKRMANGERVRHVLLHVAMPDGGSTPVALSGYPHPDHVGRLLMVLTHSGTIMSPTIRRNDEGNPALTDVFRRPLWLAERVATQLRRETPSSRARTATASTPSCPAPATTSASSSSG